MNPESPVIVSVDIDGVAADFIGRVLQQAHGLFGVSVAREQITQWDTDLCLGLSEIERKELVAGWHQPGFCASILPYPHANQGVSALRKVADVYATTAPYAPDGVINYPWHGERHRWLSAQLGFDKKHIHQTAAKQFVYADIFVEDKPETIDAWLDRHPNGVGVVAMHPYNLHAATILAEKWAHRRAETGIQQVVVVNHADETFFWKTIGRLVHEVSNRKKDCL